MLIYNWLLQIILETKSVFSWSGRQHLKIIQNWFYLVALACHFQELKKNKKIKKNFSTGFADVIFSNF